MAGPAGPVYGRLHRRRDRAAARGAAAPDGAGLGVSEARVGFLVTGYAIASFAAAIPLTALLRGLPRRPVLIGALLGFAVEQRGGRAVLVVPLTFAARLVAGRMGGTLWAMLVGYAARMVPAERRGRAIAIVLAGITLALSLGVPAGTALAGAVGWRTAFGVLAGLAVLLVGWVRRSGARFSRRGAGRRLPLARVAVLPGIPAVLSVTLFLLLGHQVMYTYVAPFAAHAGFGRTGLVLLVFGAATVVGIWITGVLVDRRLRATLLGALALCAAVMLALGLSAGVPAVLLVSVGPVGHGLRRCADADPDGAGRRLGSCPRGRGHVVADHRVQRGHRRGFADRRCRPGEPGRRGAAVDRAPADRASPW